MISPVLVASLKIVESEVRTVGDKLVSEEVAHHYEEQNGKDNDSAWSQLEWVLERDVI